MAARPQPTGSVSARRSRQNSNPTPTCTQQHNTSPALPAPFRGPAHGTLGPPAHPKSWLRGEGEEGSRWKGEEGSRWKGGVGRKGVECAVEGDGGGWWRGLMEGHCSAKGSCWGQGGGLRCIAGCCRPLSALLSVHFNPLRASTHPAPPQLHSPSNSTPCLHPAALNPAPTAAPPRRGSERRALFGWQPKPAHPPLNAWSEVTRAMPISVSSTTSPCPAASPSPGALRSRSTSEHTM